MEDKTVFARHKSFRDGTIECFMWEKQEFTAAIRKDVIAWCYLDDLMALETELERTRKALDVAVDKLKGIKAYYDDSYADPHFVNWHLVAQRFANDADDAIKTITALEQKE